MALQVLPNQGLKCSSVNASRNQPCSRKAAAAHLLQGALGVVDGLAVLRAHKEPAQGAGVVLRGDLPVQGGTSTDGACCRPSSADQRWSCSMLPMLGRPAAAALAGHSRRSRRTGW
jgi:hypothetical protein